MTPRNPDDRLDSWKEIAAYLRRDVRTVQRWEKNEGLPVHRHRHQSLGSVYAHRQELAEWFSARQQTRTPATPKGEESGRIKLAVLPFKTLGGNRNDHYFSEGLAEEMITEMTRLKSSDLAVIARTTAVHFDASRESLERMKKELG